LLSRTKTLDAATKTFVNVRKDSISPLIALSKCYFISLIFCSLPTDEVCRYRLDDSAELADDVLVLQSSIIAFAKAFAVQAFFWR
jgi:hypothetical protein